MKRGLPEFADGAGREWELANEDLAKHLQRKESYTESSGGSSRRNSSYAAARVEGGGRVQLGRNESFRTDEAFCEWKESEIFKDHGTQDFF
jgi:hypothetical protein